MHRTLFASLLTSSTLLFGASAHAELSASDTTALEEMACLDVMQKYGCEVATSAEGIFSASCTCDATSLGSGGGLAGAALLEVKRSDGEELATYLLTKAADKWAIIRQVGIDADPGAAGITHESAKVEARWAQAGDTSYLWVIYNNTMNDIDQADFTLESTTHRSFTLCRADKGETPGTECLVLPLGVDRSYGSMLEDEPEVQQTSLWQPKINKEGRLKFKNYKQENKGTSQPLKDLQFKGSYTFDSLKKHPEAEVITGLHIFPAP